jgi:hypothetical protein
MLTSDLVATNEAPLKLLIQRTEIPHTPWVYTNSRGVGGCVRAGYESQLLDAQKYDSVSAALTALNAGEVDCGSFCFVFSCRDNSYHLLWPLWVTEKEVDDFTERYHSSQVSKEETDSSPERTTTDTGSMSQTDASSKLEAVADNIADGFEMLTADKLAERECSSSPVSKEEIPQRSEENKLYLNVSSFSEVSTTGSSFAEEMATPSGAPVSYGLKSSPDRHPVVSSVNLSRPGAPDNPGMTMSEGRVVRDAIPGESVVDNDEIQLADLCCDAALLPCSQTVAA